MRTDLYTICWNEARMLPYFFRHYDRFVEHYIFYDDGSTDGTLDILAGRSNVEVRPFVRAVPDSYVRSAQVLHENMWKESRGRADWVIITAVDEHLHHPDLSGYLTRLSREDITAVPALGYQMIAQDFPGGDGLLAETVTFGAPFAPMSKLSIFNPASIAATGFELGRHMARPEGRVRFPQRDEVFNLHYKYMGLAYTHERHQMLKTGLGPTDLANRWGHRYQFSLQELERDYRDFEARAIDTSAPVEMLELAHREPRWWRSPT